MQEYNKNILILKKMKVLTIKNIIITVIIGMKVQKNKIKIMKVEINKIEILKVVIIKIKILRNL